MAYDFDIEDIEEFHKRYTWGEGLSNESIYNSKQTLPVICYDLIDLDKTKYHFSQNCFDNKDIKSYFKAIKYISKWFNAIPLLGTTALGANAYFNNNKDE